MKTLVVALLLGVASISMAAVVPERTGKSVSVSGTDMTKRQILVDDFSSQDEIKDEDLAHLNRYSNMATKENIAVVRNMDRLMNQNPEVLMAEIGKLNPNLKAAENHEVKAVVEEDVIEAHKQALKRLEQIGRKNMGEKAAPVMLMPTIEEIKQMGIEQHLPDGWEEVLANSKEYQEEMKKRKSSGKELDLNDPEAVAKMVQQFQ